jgi:hypothetical protein
MATLPVIVSATAASAGGQAFTGKEKGFWSADRYLKTSLVYADVVSVKKTGATTATVVLDIRATLTGTYDAAVSPVLEADVGYSFRSSAIRRPPAAKAHVLVVLQKAPDGRFYIPTDYMVFMHAVAGIVEVESFNDPKVAKTIARLREIRAAKPRDVPDYEDDKRAAERAYRERDEEAEKERNRAK